MVGLVGRAGFIKELTQMQKLDTISLSTLKAGVRETYVGRRVGTHELPHHVLVDCTHGTLHTTRKKYSKNRKVNVHCATPSRSFSLPFLNSTKPRTSQDNTSWLLLKRIEALAVATGKVHLTAPMETLHLNQSPKVASDSILGHMINYLSPLGSIQW